MKHSTGDVEPLLHSPRVLLYPPVRRFRQTDDVEDFVDSPFGLPADNTLQGTEESEILNRRQAPIQAPFAPQDQSDSRSNGARLVPHVQSEEFDLATGGEK